jgi:cytochrome c oxidase subunit 1/cytochrome c oxidase subunit I+III
VIASLRAGEPAGADPWGGHSLEWATTSPPPPYNFARIRVVLAREPLWDAENRRQSDQALAPADGDVRAVRTAVDERFGLERETPGTTLLDAEPDEMLRMPEDSYWPLALALGLAVLFTGLLTSTVVLVVIGAAVALAAIVGWLWPTSEERAHDRPVGPIRPDHPAAAGAAGAAGAASSERGA